MSLCGKTYLLVVAHPDGEHTGALSPHQLLHEAHASVDGEAQAQGAVQLLGLVLEVAARQGGQRELEAGQRQAVGVGVDLVLGVVVDLVVGPVRVDVLVVGRVVVGVVIVPVAARIAVVVGAFCAVFLSRARIVSVCLVGVGVVGQVVLFGVEDPVPGGIFLIRL